MTVIKSSVKKKNFNDENEFIFYKENDDEKIKLCLIKYSEKVSINEKILYFDFYNQKKDLIKKYSFLNNRKIVIMDIDCPSIDEIEQYIIKQKPKHIFISYYKLVSNKENLLIMGEKLGYILNKIEEYSKKYGVKFIVAINKEN